jgi:uncharacterized protein (TIGR03435 family)
MAARLAAQAPAASDPVRFTVVSIKPNTSGTNRSNLDLQPGGRFVAINVSLMQLVRIAYGDDGPLTRDRLTVNEAWAERRRANTDQYDIQAIAERDLTQQDLPAALRRLLEDRFALVVHHETKALRGYDLVLARAGGTLGPRLRRSAIDCSQPQAAQSDGRSACGFQNYPGQAHGRVLIADLAKRVMENALADGRPVADETGLEGTFEFDLEWTPDQTAAPRRPDAPPAPPVDPNGPSLVTALREQLGLKLEPQEVRIDVVVVDHAEVPAAN